MHPMVWLHFELAVQMHPMQAFVKSGTLGLQTAEKKSNLNIYKW